MVKLLRVIYARNPEKKWRAEFSDNTGVEFGQAGADDYTISKNRGQRERYRARHKVDLMGDDPRTPGYLAWHLLWGESTSLAKNIATYKRLYDL
jgi:hypothetical protein